MISGAAVDGDWKGCWQYMVLVASGFGAGYDLGDGMTEMGSRFRIGDGFGIMNHRNGIGFNFGAQKVDPTLTFGVGITLLHHCCSFFDITICVGLPGFTITMIPRESVF